MPGERDVDLSPVRQAIEAMPRKSAGNSSSKTHPPAWLQSGAGRSKRAYNRSLVCAARAAFILVLMIGLVTASSLIWYSCVSLFMSSGPVMRRFQSARHWIERAAGVCFIGLGGKVLADAGRPIS